MGAFTGLSAFPITPCDADGRLDAGHLRRLLAPLVEAGVDSIGLLGSTGTYAYLTREERRRAVTVAAEAVAGRVPLLVGSGRCAPTRRSASPGRQGGGATRGCSPPSPTRRSPRTRSSPISPPWRRRGAAAGHLRQPGHHPFPLHAALIGRLARLPGVVAAKCPGPPPRRPRRRSRACGGRAGGLPPRLQRRLERDGGADRGRGRVVQRRRRPVPEPCLAIVRAVQAGDAARARASTGDGAPLWDLFKATRPCGSCTRSPGRCRRARSCPCRRR